MKLQDRIGQSNFFFTRARTRVRSLVVTPVKTGAQWLLMFWVPAFAGMTAINLSAADIDAKTQQQLQAIQNANTQICLPAIQALGHSNNSAVVQPLADAFTQENRPIVRRYIVEALGYLRNRSTIPTLKQALNDSDVQVRQSAVAAVGLLGAGDVQDILLADAANEKDPVVKRQLVHHLGLLHTPGAINALKTFKRDSDPAVSRMATDTVGKEAK